MGWLIFNLQEYISTAIAIIRKNKGWMIPFVAINSILSCQRCFLFHFVGIAALFFVDAFTALQMAVVAGMFGQVYSAITTIRI